MVRSIVLLFMLSCSAHADDFRGYDWGTPYQQILKNELAPTVGKNQNMLLYADSIIGIDMALAYVFVNGQLSIGSYSSRENYANDNHHVRDYHALQGLLSEKYGEPVEVKEQWGNELYRDRPDQYGRAISVGHLILYSEWITDRTKVTLGCHGEKFDVSLAITYQDLSTLGQYLKDKESESKKKL